MVENIRGEDFDIDYWSKVRPQYQRNEDSVKANMRYCRTDGGFWAMASLNWRWRMEI